MATAPFEKRARDEEENEELEKWAEGVYNPPLHKWTDEHTRQARYVPSAPIHHLSKWVSTFLGEVTCFESYAVMLEGMADEWAEEHTEVRRCIIDEVARFRAFMSSVKSGVHELLDNDEKETSARLDGVRDWRDEGEHHDRLSVIRRSRTYIPQIGDILAQLDEVWHRLNATGPHALVLD